MKSLDELKKIHDRAQSKIAARGKHEDTKILVGMSTCGISAGAKPVMDEFIDKISEYNLKNISVTPVGCIGECAIEPIVEIYKGNERTTYCRLDKNAVERIVIEHIIGGNVVLDYVIGKYRL